MSRYLTTDNPEISEESPQPIAEPLPQMAQPPERWEDPPWPDNVSPAWTTQGQNVTESTFQWTETIINAMVHAGVLSPVDRSNKAAVAMATRKVIDCYLFDSIQAAMNERAQRLGAEATSWGHGPRPRRAV